MIRLALLAAALFATGCLDPVYPCHDDANCVTRGSQGRCVPAGAGASYCAFPDSICPSELRWDPSAPSPLAKNCVGRLGDGGSATD